MYSKETYYKSNVLPRLKKLNTGYTYPDDIEYINIHQKIDIICPQHGSFLQSINKHLRGTRCPKCKSDKIGGIKRGNIEDFIKKANEKYNNRYDYSKSIYTNNETKLEIICPQHGSFLQTPVNHLFNKIGCPTCAGRTPTSLLDDVYHELYKGTDYIYHGVVTVPESTKPNIRKFKMECPIHKVIFYSTTTAITGCPKCSGRLTDKELIDKATEYYKDKYTYHAVTRTTNERKHVVRRFTVECKNHPGELFYPNVYDHILAPKLERTGCPRCKSSKIENFVHDYLTLLGIKFKYRDKSVLKKYNKELDFYVPGVKVAIEVNGNFWHSEAVIYTMNLDNPKPLSYYRNHLFEKTKLCAKEDIQLIHLYEDEIINKPEQVKLLLAHKLGVSEFKEYARKLTVKKCDSTEAKEFLDSVHIQGKCNFKKAYGLYDTDGDLLSVMAFSFTVSNRGSVSDSSNWELVRFATIGNIVGGASKLLSRFIKDTPECKNIISYSDNRLSYGNLYDKLGFEFDNNTPVKPDYYYVTSKDNYIERLHKSRLKKDNQKKLFKENYNDTLTEYENAINNNYYRLYNCGLMKWILKVKE